MKKPRISNRKNRKSLTCLGLLHLIDGFLPVVSCIEGRFEARVLGEQGHLILRISDAEIANNTANSPKLSASENKRPFRRRATGSERVVECVVTSLLPPVRFRRTAWAPNGFEKNRPSAIRREAAFVVRSAICLVRARK